MPSLTLKQASIIIKHILIKSREKDCLPLTVAVLDPGGHLIAFKREDGSGILRPQIAIGKAWSALGMGLGTRELSKRAAHIPVFFTALMAASEGKMIPVPGGVLVRSEHGQIMGAVGISGDTADRDEEVSIEGIRLAGLNPDGG